MVGKRGRGTLRQPHIRILNALQFLLERQGYSPSIRELCAQVGIDSTSHMHYLLEQLDSWGYIKKPSKVSRAIQLLRMPDGQPVKSSAPAHHIPFYGRIQAGSPIPIPDSNFSLLDPESRFVDVPTSLLPTELGGLYALEVQGDSMKDAMINHGDIVIMRRIDAPVNGDMVAAWLKEDGETTLKYFYREGDQVRLQPANPDYEPIYVHLSNIEIHGKVVLSWRRYSN